MTLRWPVGMYAVLALGVAFRGLDAQTPPSVHLVKGSVPPAVTRFHHGKTLSAAYDSVADSTHLSLVTHKGKYFFTTERPRLTWSVVYAGQRPGAEVPAEVWLEFRTQNPQVALGSRLELLYGNDERLEVLSSGAYSDPGVQTWSHFMRFRIPTAALADVVRSQNVRLNVGGVQELLQPDHLEALRDLLSRVGAYDGPSLWAGGA